MAGLQDRPKAFQEKIFTKLFTAAEIANYSKQDQEIYVESLKHFRDLKNVMDKVKEEGKTEGRIEGKIEGKIEVASEMKKKVLDVKFIAEITGLSEKEIDLL